MTRAQAITQATARARQTGRFMYAVKDGLASDYEWEVCTEADLDDWHAGASCVVECDDEGAVPESA